MSPVYATGEVTGIVIIACLIIALLGPGRLHPIRLVIRRGRPLLRSEKTNHARATSSRESTDNHRLISPPPSQVKVHILKGDIRDSV